MNREHSKHRTLISVVCILLALLIIIPLVLSAFTSALAITTPEIEALKQQAEELEKQKEEMKSQIEAMEDEKQETLEKKAALDQEIALTEEEIETTTALVQEIAVAINEQQVELEAKEAEEAEQSEQYTQRVRAMEESGTVNYLGVILQADSFSEFLDRLTLVSEIIDYDQQVAADLEVTRQDIADKQAEIEASQAEETEYQQLLVDKQAELEEEYAEATELIEEINSNIDSTQAAIDEAEQDQADLQQQIKELVAQAEKEEAERQRQEALKKQQEELAKQNSSSNKTSTSTSTSTYSSTTFIWPCPGHYSITSAYGMRYHPVLHVYKLHSGTDISASTGTPVVAAAPGTVLKAGWSTAYGNYVVIYHGNGISTLYGHMSALKTYAGATVSAGDTIGLVGMTGYATGPHLHFEVIINGSTVNPMQYFS